MITTPQGPLSTTVKGTAWTLLSTLTTTAIYPVWSLVTEKYYDLLNMFTTNVKLCFMKHLPIHHLFKLLSLQFSLHTNKHHIYTTGPRCSLSLVPSPTPRPTPLFFFFPFSLTHSPSLFLLASSIYLLPVTLLSQYTMVTPPAHH